MSSLLVNFGLGCFFALSVKNSIESIFICIKRKNQLNCIQTVSSICQTMLSGIFFLEGYKLYCQELEIFGLILYYIFQTGNVYILTIRFSSLVDNFRKKHILLASATLYFLGILFNFLSRILYNEEYINCKRTIIPSINLVSKSFLALLYLFLLSVFVLSYIKKISRGSSNSYTDKIIISEVLKVSGTILSHIIVVVFFFFFSSVYTRVFFHLRIMLLY